jgi:hypothetical protein
VCISNKANSTYFTPKIQNLGFQRTEACPSTLWVGHLARLVANIALVWRWVWLWVMCMASKHIHCCPHECKWIWTINLWFLLIHHLIQFHSCCCFCTHVYKIWIFKIYVFVMLKMRNLINKMQCNILSEQMGCFDGKMFASILKLKGSNFTSHLWVVNNGKLIYPI